MKNVANASHTIVARNNANVSRAFTLCSFKALVTYILRKNIAHAYVGGGSDSSDNKLKQ